MLANSHVSSLRELYLSEATKPSLLRYNEFNIPLLNTMNLISLVLLFLHSC